MCRGLNGYLVEIGDEEENQFIKRFTAAHPPNGGHNPSNFLIPHSVANA